MKSYFFTLLIFMSLPHVWAQSWRDVVDLQGYQTYCLEVNGPVIAAGTDRNVVFFSGDSGYTWRASSVGALGEHISGIGFWGSKVFAATSNQGIYRTDDTGRTWVRTAANVLPATSFCTWNGVLYATTMGSGVLAYNPTNNTWIAKNEALPSYSFTVHPLVVAGTDLVAFAGANGTYYRMPTPSSTWAENTFEGRLLPGLQVTDALAAGGRIYAVSAPRLYTSDDNGLTWNRDETATYRASYRYLHSTPADIYLVSYKDFVGTWLQRRAHTEQIGSTWGDDEIFFPRMIAYVLRSVGPKLFMGYEGGLKMLDNRLAAAGAKASSFSLEIFPQPSVDGRVTIRGGKCIQYVRITTVLGKEVLHLQPHAPELTLTLPSGLYIAHIRASGHTASMRMYIQ